MTAKADYAEDQAIKWMMTGAAVTRPTAWYVALHTGDPGEAGSANEIGAGVGYARQSAAFTSNGDGTVDNDALITFGPNTNTNWGSVTHVSVWTAASGGSCLYKGPLTAAKTVNIGDSLDIAAAALVVGET